MNKIIGTIEWKDSGEIINYTNVDNFIKDIKEEMYYRGYAAFGTIINVSYNKQNIDLAWEIIKIFNNELGLQESKNQFIINYYQPDFHIEEKLYKISLFGTNRAKKRIAHRHTLDNYAVLESDFANSFCNVKKLKKWIDRNYEKAIRRENSLK